jgi:hypothetical protein
MYARASCLRYSLARIWSCPYCLDNLKLPPSIGVPGYLDYPLSLDVPKLNLLALLAPHFFSLCEDYMDCAKESAELLASLLALSESIVLTFIDLVFLIGSLFSFCSFFSKSNICYLHFLDDPFLGDCCF